jgi:hypothetical protein
VHRLSHFFDNATSGGWQGPYWPYSTVNLLPRAPRDAPGGGVDHPHYLQGQKQEEDCGGQIAHAALYISYLGPHGMPLDELRTILTISRGSSKRRMAGGRYTRTVLVKHGVNCTKKKEILSGDLQFLPLIQATEKNAYLNIKSRSCLRLKLRPQPIYLVWGE